MISRDDARQVRRVARPRLAPAEEAQAMAEAYRAVSEHHAHHAGDTVQDKIYWQGYGQALKDLAREIGDRRQFFKDRRAQ